MAGFKIIVSDTKDWWGGHVCFHHNDLTAPSSVKNVTCPVHGRYVTFYNERNATDVYPLIFSKFAYIQLCELEVLGKQYLTYVLLVSIHVAFMIFCWLKT